MTPQYDQGWFTYFGNRLATALLIVKTATKGGGTVFPYLRTVVQPEPGKPADLATYGACRSWKS